MSDHLFRREMLFEGVFRGVTNQAAWLTNLIHNWTQASMHATASNALVLDTLANIDSGRTNEAVGVSNITVHNKISDLEKRGVILGYSYSIDPYKIGYSSFDLLINTSSRTTSFKKDFFEFSAAHPHIIGLTECIGQWQYEVRIEVNSTSEATKISQEISRRFSQNIHNIDIVNVIKELKYMKTPLIELSSTPEVPPQKKKNVA